MQKNREPKRLNRSAVTIGVLAVMSIPAAYAADGASATSTPAPSAANTPAPATAPVATATPQPDAVPASAAAPTSSAPEPASAAQPTASMVPAESSASTASSALKQKTTDTTSEKSLDQTFKAAERQYSLSKQGSWSVIYDFGYSYYANTAIDIALDSSSSTIDRFRIENNAQHAVTNTFTLQYGLLNNLTLTGSVPFVAKINPPNQTSAYGLGDVTLGARWEPFPIGTTKLPLTFFGSVTAPSGDSPYDINPLTDLSTGQGYYSVGGGVSTRKFIDPIVLFGTLSANYGFDVNGLDQANGDRILTTFKPGYTLGFGFGFAYSLNYDVSLTISYQQSFAIGSEYDFSDGSISKSANASAATLTSSLGIRVTPKTIVNASLGFGLTPDAPNVTLGLSLPLDFLGLGHQVQ